MHCVLHSCTGGTEGDEGAESLQAPQPAAADVPSGAEAVMEVVENCYSAQYRGLNGHETGGQGVGSTSLWIWGSATALRRSVSTQEVENKLLF